MHEQYQSNQSYEYDITTIDCNIESKIPDNIEFSISRVSTVFIKSLLENLKTNNLTGKDDNNAEFLKMATTIICKPRSHLLNLSIKTEIYPKMLKKAKVTSTFKKGDKN